jgi:hypothetical protein
MLYVRSAYGRIYSTFEEIISDWEADKDFYLIQEHRYINKSDWKKYNKGWDSVVFPHENNKYFLEYGFYD